MLESSTEISSQFDGVNLTNGLVNQWVEFSSSSLASNPRFLSQRSIQGSTSRSLELDETDATAITSIVDSILPSPNLEFLNSSIDNATNRRSQTGDRLQPRSTLVTDSITGLESNRALAGTWGRGDRLTTAQNTSVPAVQELDRTAASTNRSISLYQGTLAADQFIYRAGNRISVFSGNGNVEFGDGEFDQINFSTLSSNSVEFNFASLTGGGVVFDSGDGARVFDSITLNNGSQILFEGIDRLIFADGSIDLAVTPNDPLFADQWNLHMTGVHHAWRLTTGSDQVLIGIQDSGLGVDSAGMIHPDLRIPWRYLNNYEDELGISSYSHGTAVQGITSATANNGYGMSGINWTSDVFHVDVLPGIFYESSDLELVEATQAMINFAQQNGQKLVVNMSLGYTNSLGQTAINPQLESLIAAHQDDVLFVIASGNEGANQLTYPANLAATYDNVIAVGASWGDRDQNGVSRTPGDRIFYPGIWGSNSGEGLTLMAPSEVISTASSGWTGTEFSFHSNAPIGPAEPLPFNGTSAATPHITGIASLIWSVDRNLSAVEIRQILEETAYDLGTPGYDLVYGYGFVNADAAVRRAIALA
jgi:hypothetical protein